MAKSRAPRGVFGERVTPRTPDRSSFTPPVFGAQWERKNTRAGSWQGFDNPPPDDTPTVVSDPTVNVAPVIGATPDVTPAVWSSGASDTQRWEMADTDAGPWSTVSDMPAIDTPYTDQTFGKVLRWVEAQGGVTAESAATVAVDWPYVMRDVFTGTLAAGAVHDTLASDGTHTRKVIDTGSTLSMSGGEIVIASGTGTYNDPGIYFTPYLNLDTDVIAIGFTFRFTGTPVGALGLSTRTASGSNVTGQPDYGMVTPSAAANIRLGYRTTGQAVTYFPAILTVSTDYQCVIISRAGQGLKFLIKGGAFTDWSLIGTMPPLAMVDASPALMTHSGAYRLLDVRATTLIPAAAAIAADSFNRSNGALGSTDGSVNGDTGGGSLAWSAVLGTWGVATNKAQASALDGTTSNAIAIIDPGVDGVVYEVRAARTGGAVGIVLKYVDADNYIRMVLDGTNHKLIKRVAGVETDVRSVALASNDNWFQVAQHGNSYTMGSGGGAVATTGTISDAVFSGVTALGLYTSDVGNTIDWFKVHAIGGSGEYADFGSPFPVTA